MVDGVLYIGSPFTVIAQQWELELGFLKTL